MTVSGAPEAAPIEPRFCRALLPAVDGNTIALCGMAPTVSGIVPHHAAFGSLTCRFNASVASIKVRHLSLEGWCTLPSLSPPSTSPVDCPLTKTPRYPMIVLFRTAQPIGIPGLFFCLQAKVICCWSSINPSPGLITTSSGSFSFWLNAIHTLLLREPLLMAAKFLERVEATDRFVWSWYLQRHIAQ